MLGAIALLLQGMVPLCLGVSAPANGAFIVICTAHGTQTIQVDGDINPLPNVPVQDQKNSACLFCSSIEQLAGFVPPEQATLSVPAVSWKAPLPAYSGEPVGSPYFSYVSRAPPSAHV